MATVSATQFFGGKVPPPPAPAPTNTSHPLDGLGVSDQIKQAFTQALQGGAAGYTQARDAKNPLQLLEGSAKLAAAPFNAAASPLAPLLGPTVGAATDAIANKISDIPAVQKFAASPAGEVTSRVAEDVGNLDTIAGGVASISGAKTGAKATSNTISKTAAETASSLKTGASSVADGAKNFVQKPIPKSVETVLQETPAHKFDEYVQAAQKATENNKNATPLEIAGQHAETALNQIQKKVQTIGQQKSDIMKSGGLSVTPVKGDIVGKFYQGLQQFRNSKTTVEGDTKLIRDVSQQAKALGKTPSAGQVDRFIDFVQGKIYTSGRDLSVPVTNETVAALRNITGKLNNDLKAQLPDTYKQVNQQYSDMLSIRDELNTKLGKDGEKGGALMKRVFSPSDANTKKLFADVLKHTGIDLTNEATLARYVMDVMGDTRQKSMLDELNLLHTSPTPSGAIGKLIDYSIAHFNTPEELIARARAKTADYASSNAKPQQPLSVGAKPATPSPELKSYTANIPQPAKQATPLSTPKSLSSSKSITQKISDVFKTNPRGMAKLPGVSPKLPQIHPEDQGVMSDLTDYVAGDYKPDARMAQRLEEDATRVWEHYFPNKQMPVSLQGMANEFAKVLEKIDAKRSQK